MNRVESKELLPKQEEFKIDPLHVKTSITASLSVQTPEEVARQADGFFIDACFDVCQESPEKAASFLSHPVIAFRLIQDRSKEGLSDVLGLLVERLENALLKQPIIQFAADLMTQIKVCDSLNSDRIKISNDLLISGRKLLSSGKLPPGIATPLSQLIQQRPEEEVNFFDNESYAASKVSREKLCSLAIKMGEYIEGYDFSEGGIRFAVHQPHKTINKDPAALVSRYIDAFQSGEKNFVFERVDWVPMQNYQKLMLETIAMLKKELQQVSDKAEPKDFVQQAKELIAFEPEVIAANNDEKITFALKKFQSAFQKLPNPGLKFSLAACLDGRAFHQKELYKPVLHSGVPQKLFSFSMSLGQAQPSFQFKLQDLRMLADGLRVVPQETQNHFAEMKDLYPSNADAYPAFRKLFSKYPQLENEIRPFLLAFERQLGIAKEDLKEVVREEGIRRYSFRKKAPYEDSLIQWEKQVEQVLEEVIDPVERHKKSILLKEDLEKVLQANPSIPENHKCRKTYAKLSELLKAYPCQSHDELPKIDFISLEKIMNDELKLPLPKLSEHVHKLSMALEKGVDLALIIEAHQALKDFLENDVLSIKSLSAQNKVDLLNAFQIVDELEESIATRLIEEKNLGLAAEMAHQQGILSEIPDLSNLDGLRAHLEVYREKALLGTRNMVGKLCNEAFEDLKKQGKTPREVVQFQQRLTNVALLHALEELMFLHEKKEDFSLQGLSMEDAMVIGPLRIMRDGDMSAKKGEIIVVSNARPDMQNLLSAGAIISEEGGVFSHAAIDFSELGIPCLLGAREAQKNLGSLQGQMVCLRLKKNNSSISPLSESASQWMEEIEKLTLENVNELYMQMPSSDFRQFFLKRLFAHSERAQLLEKIMKKSEITTLLENKWNEIGPWRRRFMETTRSMEKLYLFRKIEKAYQEIHEIVSHFSLPLISFERQMGQMRLELPLSSGLVAPKKEGKIENLVALIPIIHETPKFDDLELEIPAFEGLDFREFYPKEEINDILNKKELPLKERVLQIQDLIDKMPLPPAAHEIFERLWKETNEPMILRSSASIEDQKNRSAAGIFESVGVEKKEDFEKAFKKVVASAFAERALAYCPQWSQLFEMKVMMQRYVQEASYSGVAFSVADHGNWDVAGLQIVPGRGGGVDGEGHPLIAFIQMPSQKISDMHIDKSQIPPVSSQTIASIGGLVKTLEEKFGYPVEIEFAGKDNKLSIVQIRPVVI